MVDLLIVALFRSASSIQHAIFRKENESVEELVLQTEFVCNNHKIVLQKMASIFFLCRGNIALSKVTCQMDEKENIER